MSKKTLFLILGLALIIGGLAFVFVFQSRLLNPGREAEVESEETVNLTEWVDPAGFKFSYPEDLILDTHQEDKENYAHLELVSNEYSGRIIIWVQPTDYADIDQWAAEQAEAAQVLETELGGFLAKKAAFSDPQKLVTAAIDIDALVLIEMEPDSENYFQKAYDQIIASFEFIPLEDETVESVPVLPPAGGGGPGLPAGSQVIEEAEEVIE